MRSRPGSWRWRPISWSKSFSPGDSATAVQSKVDDWLAAGTRLVWVVDPETRSVTVHRPAGAAVVPEAGTLDGAPVFSDFSVHVRDLFT